MSDLQKTLEALAFALGRGYFFVLIASLIMWTVLPLVWFWIGLNIRRVGRELSQLNETLSLPSRRL